VDFKNLVRIVYLNGYLIEIATKLLFNIVAKDVKEEADRTPLLNFEIPGK
jgi:hypothetical protein